MFQDGQVTTISSASPYHRPRRTQSVVMLLDTSHRFRRKHSTPKSLPSQRRFCDGTYRCELVPTHRHTIFMEWQMCKDNTSCNLFPFSDFRYSFTLFSKFFASFPHGTCSLSVSRHYLALEGIYLLLWAAVPSNSTRRKHTVRTQTPSHKRDSHPLWYPVPRDFNRGYALAMPL